MTFPGFFEWSPRLFAIYSRSKLSLNDTSRWSHGEFAGFCISGFDVGGLSEPLIDDSFFRSDNNLRPALRTQYNRRVVVRTAQDRIARMVD